MQTYAGYRLDYNSISWWTGGLCKLIARLDSATALGEDAIFMLLHFAILDSQLKYSMQRNKKAEIKALLKSFLSVSLDSNNAVLLLTFCPWK